MSSLNILYITHLYPPTHTAGVEVFASITARHLAESGHRISVLTTHKNIVRRDLSVHRREHEGIPVCEITNNLFADRFEETWERPEIEALVAAELDRIQPDVVHVHHLLYLSIGVLRLASERGIPVVMTLHDFWLGCARFGQLLHADGTRCATVDPARCGSCLPSLPWRQTDAAKTVARAVGAMARTTGIDVSGPLRRVAEKKAASKGAASSGFVEPSDEAQEAYATLAARRKDELVAAVNAHVDRIILPAAFMRDWFRDLGLDESRMVVETTGVDWAGAREHDRVPRAEGEPVRLTFLGTLVPHKGAHVLLDAWEQLDPSVRSEARLRVFGPDQFQPMYVQKLRERASALDVELSGRLSREEVRREMARTDVLICPSLWFEIRPLVMLEAYAAGARVIATDLGGMAEAVHDGLDGVTFPEGDIEALAAALRSEIVTAMDTDETAEPREPNGLFRDWSKVAQSLAEHYEDLVAS